jgi:DNA-3-methyladenine glycosylase
VLLRAGQVIEGTDLAVARRPGRQRDRDLARGPARLCQALGIDRGLDGTDVCLPRSPLGIGPAAAAPGRAEVRTGPRVGISRAADWPLRFWLAGDVHVSPYKGNGAAAAGEPPTTAG